MSDGIPNYLPGMEPENIQNLLNSFFGEIDELFTDKIIVWSEWNHDRWDKAAGYLCKTLGYSRGKDFLEAYGYKIVQERDLYIGSKKSGELIENSEDESFPVPDQPSPGKKNSTTIKKPSTGKKTNNSSKNKTWLLILILAIIVLGVTRAIHFASSVSPAQSSYTAVSPSQSSYTEYEQNAIDAFKAISEYIQTNPTDFSKIPDSVHDSILKLEKLYKSHSSNTIIKQLYYVAEAISGMNVAVMAGSSYYDQAQVYLNQIDSHYKGPYSTEILKFRNQNLVKVETTSTPKIKNALTMSSSEKASVKKYIEERYEYYDSIAGKYSGDKYKDQVWSDTAKKFGISETDVTMIWQEH